MLESPPSCQLVIMVEHFRHFMIKIFLDVTLFIGNVAECEEILVHFISLKVMKSKKNCGIFFCL